jgi:PAS domain S-box-containing protein
MAWQISLAVTSLLISALISLSIAIYSWRRQGTPGARTFTGLVTAFAVWSGLEALIVLSQDLEVMLWLTKIQYLGIVTAPVFWMLFAAEYSGNVEWLTPRRRKLLFIVPALIVLLVWTTEYHSWYYQSYGMYIVMGNQMFQNTPGGFYWLNLLYSYALFAAGVAFIVRMFVNTPRPYSAQVAIVLVGAAITVIGNIIYNFGIGRQTGIDLTPLFFTLTSILIAWSLFHFQFLVITPIARELVIETMKDGMLVLDVRNRVVDINPAMKAILGVSTAEAMGKPANRVFQGLPTLATLFEYYVPQQTEITLENDSKQRIFQLEISPIANRQNQLLGWLVELRDITQRRRALLELEHFADENTRLLDQELKQRQLAESLRQTMMIISSSLEYEAIVSEILTQLRKVIPYHSAALYLLDGDQLRLERVVGPESINSNSYTTPRRHDQIQKIFQLKKAEVFMSAYSSLSEARGDPVYSSMAAPLVVGQEALGVLTIDRFEELPFTHEDAEILQAFTNQAAIAIKNAEFLQRAQEVAITQERNRLAQDLHDAVNQTLFTASIMAEALPKVWERDPEQARHGLDEIRQLTRSALSEMRTLLMELHPQRITEKTLGDLLDHLTRSVSNRLRIPVELSIENDTILPSDIQVTFYRVAQEGFNNISKHAGATQAWVSIDAQPQRALMTIRDDGQGFDPQQAIQLGHLGIGIMKERAERIGAQLHLRSEPHQGTEISLTWENRETSVR